MCLLCVIVSELKRLLVLLDKGSLACRYAGYHVLEERVILEKTGELQEIPEDDDVSHALKPVLRRETRRRDSVVLDSVLIAGAGISVES